MTEQKTLQLIEIPRIPSDRPHKRRIAQHKRDKAGIRSDHDHYGEPDTEHSAECAGLHITGGTDVRRWRGMTREELERIADDLEEVINSSVFTPYSDEEELIRKAMNELRWKAEEI